jgi:GTP 3',8-cyclase
LPKLLVDKFKRRIDYLRVSVTDLCNLRCVYCRPPQGVKLLTHDDILRYEEILTIVRVARDLGIRKIRVTGGEPLVRRGVINFIKSLAELDGIDDIGLTTNGIMLSNMAEDLWKAGLRRVNVSLDSLRRDTFAEITGSDMLSNVLEGIGKALEIGFDPVKINVVLLRGLNEKDVLNFAGLTMDTPIDVRFIERMPFGGSPELIDPPDSFSANSALRAIQGEFGELLPTEKEDLGGPATMFRLPQAKGRVGIIDPVTGHFCATCNRLRLTARGTLRPCLLGNNEIDIKNHVRSGESHEKLAQVFLDAICQKPLGRHSTLTSMNDVMNMIGG